MDYSEFADEALAKLKSKQESFGAEFNIDNYSNWFYTQSTELLRLYNETDESEEVYFKYVPVGTFSTNTETWMWAWENEDSLEQSKYDTLEVRGHGIKNDFEKLSTGCFESDKWDGWIFTAVALDLLGGIGGYKVDTDHLEKYFLIIRQVELEEVKRIEEPLIECTVHGKMRLAFICQHLNRHTKTGFEESFSTYRAMPLEEDDDFQAWCDECEKVRTQQDGWNDETMKFAAIKLVCENCYFEIKDFNTEE